ncbi:MAG: membrane protein insertion efficiency factor YidD [Gammaproteobacteria bacterium]
MNRILIVLIKIYRLLLSPWLGSHCRFFPSCSQYAIEAIETHGAGRGLELAIRRLLRCHPWCPGGVDLVPGPHCKTIR